MRVALLARFDKPRVLRETARVQEEWDSMLLTELGNQFDILHTDWFSTNSVVSYSDHHHRDPTFLFL